MLQCVNAGPAAENRLTLSVLPIWSGMPMAVSCIIWRCQIRYTSCFSHAYLICQPTRWQDASIAIGSSDDISLFVIWSWWWWYASFCC